MESVRIQAEQQPEYGTTRDRNEEISAQPTNGDYLNFKANESTLEALFETIVVSTAPIIENILKQNPTIVRAKVWHGLTLLHKLCLRGDESLILLLVDHGGDPNAGSDAGETPLHYACRKGRLPAVVALLSRGAELKAVDSTGHTCMHYAAQGGAITVMVYLNEVCGLEYDGLSSAQQTSLHVAAIHRHWQLAAFLLRKQRCSAGQADIMGNTALHLAAMNGDISTCWQIIARGGAQQLVATNGQKQTPFDMAKLETSFRHKDTQYWLKSFTNQFTKTGSVPLPTCWQLFNFLFPLAFACLLPVVLGQMVPDYQFLVYVVALAVMLRWLVQQDHRLQHPSRLPNPARAGVFVWGVMANLLAYFYCLQPYHIMHWLTNWLSWTTIFALVLAIVAFFLASPGRYDYEAMPAVSQGAGRQTRDWTGLVQGTHGANFCDECELILVEGIRHCRMCRACFRKMEHHCLFLMHCVTASNARHFLLFLVSVLTSCLAYIVNVVLYLKEAKKQDGDGTSTSFDALWQLAVNNTLVVVTLAADVFGIGVSAVLVLHYVKNPAGWLDHGHSHTQTRV